jgi:exosortase/archaeosortase family protein
VCSGFNYLYSGLALAVLVAHVLFRSWPRRVVFVGVAALAFVACNGARAFIVMAVASASDMSWLVGDDHVIFGWAIFFLVMVGLYFFAERYSDRKAHGDRVG